MSSTRSRVRLVSDEGLELAFLVAVLLLLLYKGRGPQTCRRLSCSRHFYKGLIATSYGRGVYFAPYATTFYNRDDGYHNMGNWIGEAVEDAGL